MKFLGAAIVEEARERDERIFSAALISDELKEGSLQEHAAELLT